MIVARPIGKFINGDQRGVMDKKRLMALVENFRKYRRQVPIYALGDHVESLDDRLPDGWVEDAEIIGDGELQVDTKIHGQAATYVLNDMIRGASIGTVQGKNPDGTSQGEVLQHILLTNEPFIKGLNIAAAQSKGDEPVELFFTALPSKEADMADSELQNENARLKEELAAMKAQTPDEKAAAQLKETEALLQEKIRENAELTASNENLKSDVEKFKDPAAIKELTARLKAQDRQLRASKIRRLVKDGVAEGQFNVAMVGDPKTGYDHPSDEMVLAWFKGSKFNDSFDNLEFALSTFEKKRLNRTINGAGDGLPADEVTMTEQDKEFIRRLGKDPDHVMAAMKAKDASNYAALTAKE
jgi:hypothetical protein